MNCIPAFGTTGLLLCLLAITGCNTQVAEPVSDPLLYRADFIVRPDRAERSVAVTLHIRQHRALLRELRLSIDDRVHGVVGDGAVETGDGRITWRPPADGGTLSWQVDVVHRRDENGYDAWLDLDWGLFRAEDIIPRAATRTLKGAHSETWLRFELPAGWSVVTEYFDDGGRFRVDNAERRYDEPEGWIVMGQLGVRREIIAGTRVAVAGPEGHSVRRMDTLALLHWTLPELARILPEMPQRLTIASAGEPMWRGGLSAPQSLFLHAERPLISENATSTLLHEVMHMGLGMSGADGFDWIVEGLAEYYSLQLLYRSGSISPQRYEVALADIGKWAESAAALCGPRSSGATTALAVTVFDALNTEIMQLSDDRAGLDDLVADLWRHRAINLQDLQDAAAQIAGSIPDALHIDKLPGCRNMQRPAADN